MINAIFLAALAAILTFGMMPLVISLGRRLKVMDQPCAGKIHTRSVPRFGGTGVAAGFGLTWLALVWVYRSSGAGTSLVNLAWPALILFLAGLADDLRPMSPRLKLALTIFAGAVLCLVWPFKFASPALTGLGYFLLVLWTAFLTNALNLFDGLDALAAGQAAIALAFFALIAFLNRQTGLASLSLIGAGACLGFLPFNWHPARIFLGDGGSYFLGGLLTTVSACLLGGLSHRILAVLVVLALPATDSAVVLSKRVLAHRSMISGDLQHTYNRWLDRRGHYRRTVLELYGLALFFGLVGTAMFFLDAWTDLAIFAMVVTLILMRLAQIGCLKGDKG